MTNTFTQTASQIGDWLATTFNRRAHQTASQAIATPEARLAFGAHANNLSLRDKATRLLLSSANAGDFATLETLQEALKPTRALAERVTALKILGDSSKRGEFIATFIQGLAAPERSEIAACAAALTRCPKNAQIFTALQAAIDKCGLQSPPELIKAFGGYHETFGDCQECYSEEVSDALSTMLRSYLANGGKGGEPAYRAAEAAISQLGPFLGNLSVADVAVSCLQNELIAYKASLLLQGHFAQRNVQSALYDAFWMAPPAWPDQSGLFPPARNGWTNGVPIPREVQEYSALAERISHIYASQVPNPAAEQTLVQAVCLHICDGVCEIAKAALMSIPLSERSKASLKKCIENGGPRAHSAAILLTRYVEEPDVRNLLLGYAYHPSDEITKSIAALLGRREVLGELLARLTYSVCDTPQLRASIVLVLSSSESPKVQLALVGMLEESEPTSSAAFSCLNERSTLHIETIRALIAKLSNPAACEHATQILEHAGFSPT